MDTQRKKAGRMPKATLLIRAGEGNDNDEDGNENLHVALTGADTLVAISPVDEVINVSSPLSSTGAGTVAATDSVECRRSSRKKIPKFDVRDLLLNKHRKPHKIQIEARFDSNAPSTTRVQTMSGVVGSVSGTGSAIISNPTTISRSADKCFIEKTSIIQRTPTAAQVPIPVTTEIFKPSQTSSLIVAQMASSSSTTAQRQQHFSKNMKAVTMTNPTMMTPKITSIGVETDAITPKRRGRPPKNRAAIENKKIFEQQQTALKNVEDVGDKCDVVPLREIDKADENIGSSVMTTGIETLAEEPTQELNQKLDEIETNAESQTVQIASESILDNPNNSTVLEQTLDITEMITDCEENKSGTNSPKNLEQQSNSGSVSPPRKTTTPTRRCERRSGRRLDDATVSKTLEETFAEIAAKSSKAILELAVQNPNDDLQQQSPNADPTSELIIETKVLLENEVSENLLKSPATSAIVENCLGTQQTTVKKRGRPARAKISISEESLSEEISLESNESLTAEIQKQNNVSEKEASNDKVFSKQIPNLDINLQTETIANFDLMSMPSEVTENYQNFIQKSAEKQANDSDDNKRSPQEKETNELDVINDVCVAESTSGKRLQSDADINRQSVEVTVSASLEESTKEEIQIQDKPAVNDKDLINNSEISVKYETNDTIETEIKGMLDQTEPNRDDMLECRNVNFEIAATAKAEAKAIEEILLENSNLLENPKSPKEKIIDIKEEKISTCTENQTNDSNKMQIFIEKSLENELVKDGSVKTAKKDESIKETRDLTSDGLDKKSYTKNPNSEKEATRKHHKKKHTDKYYSIENEKEQLKNHPIKEFSKKKHRDKSTDKIADTDKERQHSRKEHKYKSFDSNARTDSEISNKIRNKSDVHKDDSKKEKVQDKTAKPRSKESKETFEDKLFAISQGIEMRTTTTAIKYKKDSKSKEKTDKMLNAKSKDVSDSNTSTDNKSGDLEKKRKDDSHKKYKKHKSEKDKIGTKASESHAPAASSTPVMTTSTSALTAKKVKQHSATPASSASSHKTAKKRYDSFETIIDKESSVVKSLKKSQDHDIVSSSSKDKDKEKHARKERQRKLQADLKSALETKMNNATVTPVAESNNQAEVTTANVDKTDLTLTTLKRVEVKNPSPNTTYPELEQMPPTPGSSHNLDLSGASLSSSATDLNMPKSSTVDADPFYDIAKFIEDGVNLLKRDYKLTENEEEIVQETDTEAKDFINETMEDNDENKTMGFYETPATTPAQTTPSSSPVPTTGDNTTDNSLDTYYYSDGKRRSHRLKKITNTPKALEGRGLAKLHYSLEDHLTDLAEVEAKNAQFLKDMEERLSNFQVIKESEYNCERLISREARKMICDCFLTPDEAERGELGCGEDCLNRLLMIECGVNCKVGERCTNQRFQKLLCAPCRVFRTEKKGFGIMADVAIHPGEFIMEYVGEVLDSDEFEKRRMAYSKDKNRHYYFMALRSDSIIDATRKGNISRFINHSCDPNAETQKWTVNGELRVGFFSRKTIMPGEEITFDYQYQRYGREAQRCYCESANCRGWIGEEPDSEEGEQIDGEDDEDEDDEDEEDEEEDDEEEEDDVDEDTAITAASTAAAGNSEMLKTKSTAQAAKSNELDADISKQKFMDYLGKISAKIDGNNKQKKIKEKKLRKKRKRKQVAEKRRTKADRFLEDPDLEDEIDFLSRCGLKNQSDTLRFSRLMVRAKLLTTRLNLLAILREGELPCRRLFLDYHGLFLLHGWMNEDGRTDMNMRMALLQTLECLPIANKTILTDSKVYQALRNWCSNSEDASKTVIGTTEAGGSSSSPSDESSKESGEQKNQKENEQQQTQDQAQASGNKSVEIEKYAAKLLTTWNNLPDIFRIPKRERIEQMKEHEREADRQYAATIEASSEPNQKSLSSTDRYQCDRFQRRFGKQYGIRNFGVFVSGTGTTSGFGSSYKKSSLMLSSEDTKNMSKEQRRELFAAKVALEEEEKRLAERRREFETKCSFFGLDPRVTRPEEVPFCVSDSGQWFNDRRQQIAKPPAFAHVQTAIKPKSTNPADYYLPKAAINLPPDWSFAITDQGTIYYYHLEHRIPQWEPPTTEQIVKTKWSETEDEARFKGDGNAEIKEFTEERIKEIEAIQTQEELGALLKKITMEQRQARYKRLVEERPISPRREEDRVYNQIEMRKYKENKEKIKKRKEEIRRRRSEAAKGTSGSTVPYLCTLGSLLDATSKASGNGGASTTVDAGKVTEQTAELPEGALPIQDYLLSSDDDDHAADVEEEDIDKMKAECNNSPLLEKIVQGDKIVDELDALTTKRQLKRPLPPHRDLSLDLNSSARTAAPTEATNALVAAVADAAAASIEHSSGIVDKIDYKKRRTEKKEKSKRSRSDSSETKYRKMKEKFRCEIAGLIVQHLKPYRKESCTFARISSNEDFNHLARKLTHFVMVKELKYCEAVGQMLVVTESVKNKSREFIKKYMAKYKNGYVKPDNDPDFKDIPFKI